MAEVRLIKRYANRKLYDTSDKRYVTLEQIATLVREGEEIKVVDNKSDEDLTSVTLSQILYEQEKKRESGLPKNFLTELVKSSTTLFDYLRKTMTAWLQAAHVSEEAIERHLDELVKRGQLSLEEAKKLRKEFVERTREYMARVDKTIDERVGDMLSRLRIPSRRDVDDLAEHVERLTRRIEDLLPRFGGESKSPTPASAADSANASAGPGADRAAAAAASPAAPQPEPAAAATARPGA